ncbi:MAG: alpha/beta fold hydrolase [Marmoricola sp.]
MEAMIDVGRDRLWVEDLGGAGPAVVLVHPGIHDSTVWNQVLPLLDGFRVIRFDFRDFGRSSAATEPFRPMDDLRSVLDHLGLERAHLVGNSMGGEACLALALEHPQRVASLTLLAPGIGGYEFPDEPELEAEFEQLMVADDHDGLVAFAGRLWCAAGVDDAIRAQLEAADAVEANQTELRQDNPEQWSRAGTVTQPVTVVVGELDYPSGTAAAVALAGRIPGAELVRIAESDHLPGLRAPERVVEAIRGTVVRAA